MNVTVFILWVTYSLPGQGSVMYNGYIFLTISSCKLVEKNRKFFNTMQSGTSEKHRYLILHPSLSKVTIFCFVSSSSPRLFYPFLSWQVCSFYRDSLPEKSCSFTCSKLPIGLHAQIIFTEIISKFMAPKSIILSKMQDYHKIFIKENNS